MKRVKLTQGKWAIIDDEDEERVKAFKWCLQRNDYTRKSGETIYKLYAARSTYKEKSRSTALLHRFILGANPGQEVDHVNGNGLDCRRKNLRFATRSQNRANSKFGTGVWNKKGYATSRYTGVKFWGRKSSAVITVRNKKIHLGSFNSEKQAARAYDHAAVYYHGEFATGLNFKRPKATA